MTRNVIVLGAAHPHVLSLAQAAATSNQLRLIGLYDEDPTVRQKAADHLDVPKFDHLDVAMRAEPSLALIGAIPRLRTALAEHAVAAGAAVLCDKPIALNLAQLTRLQDAQRQYGKPIITYHPYRGTPKIRAARDAFAAGGLSALFASGGWRGGAAFGYFAARQLGEAAACDFAVSWSDSEGVAVAWA